MSKTSRSKEYQLFLVQLRAAREGADLTQVQLADALSQPQSYISKVERGERRLDVIELRHWIRALGGETVAFVQELEGLLERHSDPGSASRRALKSG